MDRQAPLHTAPDSAPASWDVRGAMKLLFNDRTVYISMVLDISGDLYLINFTKRLGTLHELEL